MGTIPTPGNSDTYAVCVKGLRPRIGSTYIINFTKPSEKGIKINMYKKKRSVSYDCVKEPIPIMSISVI